MARPIPDGALLGLDLGSSRIGVAACDSGRILAYPVATIQAGESVDAQVAALVEEHQAAAVVVGYPLTLNGSAGIAAEKVREVATRIARALSVPVWLVDERLSTAEAYRRLRETGRTSRRARGVIDAQAAVGILESVLNALNQSRMIGRELELEATDGCTR